MARDNDQIISHLRSIETLLGDLNAIRHGEYEPPKGASSNDRRPPMATPDDIYTLLEGIESRLQRQNVLLWQIGAAITKDEDSWARKVQDY